MISASSSAEYGPARGARPARSAVDRRSAPRARGSAPPPRAAGRSRRRTGQVARRDEALDRRAGRGRAEPRRPSASGAADRAPVLADQAEDAQVGAVHPEDRGGRLVDRVGGGPEVGGGPSGLVASSNRQLLRHSKEFTVGRMILRRSKGFAMAASTGALPSWLPLANRVVRALTRLGLPLGTVAACSPCRAGAAASRARRRSPH